jgi:glutamine amidotransferase
MTLAAVIDYKVGNIFSIVNALKKTGFTVTVTSDEKEILDSDAVILPGVGNFGVASRNLKPLSMIIRECHLQNKPILGSCLGTQLLFEWSEEAEGEGLGLIQGSVARFSSEVKTPHMGWNTLNPTRHDPLLEGIGAEDYFYFVHSYYVKPTYPENVLTETEYDIHFPSIVADGSLYGAQFHPEKSGKTGARLLSNFAGLVRR